MVAYQLSVFAENKPGRLAKVTGILGKEKINIRAITIATSDVFGVVNLLVDDPQRAVKALEKEGLTVSLRQVVAVLIEDRPGGLDRLVQLLAKEGINVENAYGFVLESWKRAVFVIDVDQMEKTQRVLDAAGFETLSAQALSNAEPFHYMKY
ncbi:MAG TPA: ACT domain-containing protein [Syntrophales bacterium]|nr:ACT domain-containing protein [Syntrophales bacterium]HPX10973.1 ACT domain-containing protein [Syntrophales bacterium]HQN77014.1 ACT domain-containing protein [Syntrophales bacterium]HQQ26375.1 ACT domain-containing protein [Syntrophales bacterium]